MRFPNTNKVHQDLNTTFGENAALLEEKMKKVDWLFMLKFYFSALVVVLVTIFALIIVVRIALA